MAAVSAEAARTWSSLRATLRRLDLPTNEFAIFGSAQLGIRGLRVIRDLDLVVEPRLWSELRARYKVRQGLGGVSHIDLAPHIEALDSWWPFVGTPAELIARADTIDGFHIVDLETVVRWKSVSDRPKDVADLRLLHDGGVAIPAPMGTGSARSGAARASASTPRQVRCSHRAR